MKGWIIFAVVVAVLIAIIAVLYFLGKKAEKKQAEQQEQMKAAAQNISMLIIDKKRMKLKEAGLPAVVLENTPKYLRGAKMPIVKAKVGPKVMTLMCDDKIFPYVPVKKGKSCCKRSLHYRCEGNQGSTRYTTEEKGILGKIKGR